MNYKLVVLDIDGTLRPKADPCVPAAVVKAVEALQRAGVKVAIGTGRGAGSIPYKMLSGLKPDYWICDAGAHVRDAAGNEIFMDTLSNEEMYALVDFFEDYDLPLSFSFTDASYAYIGYEQVRQVYANIGGDACIRDGEDQNRHLKDMPFSAFGFMPKVLQPQFQAKYGYLGLRFLCYGEKACDILRPNQDKAFGLAALLRYLNLPATQAVAVGDGENDCKVLEAAGLGVCVENGCADAKAAADRLCPAPEELGLVTLFRELWPEAFAAQDAHNG